MRVLIRDNFTCQQCGTQERTLAHHIKQERVYPQLALETDYGVTLCRECHNPIPKQLALFRWIPRSRRWSESRRIEPTKRTQRIHATIVANRHFESVPIGAE